MFEAGIHLDMPSATYFADPCDKPSLTQSIAKILIERSPAHARLEHPRLTPPTPDDTAEKYVAAQAIGNDAHAMLIGRGKTMAIGSFDAWTTKEAKLFKAEAIGAGREPILAHHHLRAVSMVMSARKQLLAMGLEDAFTEGKGHGEVCIAWQEGDLWMRSLIDWLPTWHDVVWDYKTTGLSVAPHAIPSLMLNGDWAVQAAMQERGMDIIDPGSARGRKYRFVAQENEPPYALTVCELTPDVLTMGRKRLDYAVKLWGICTRSDIWPAYPPEICRPEYPGFAETKWLQRETHEAARERHPKAIAPDHLMAG